jgi:hypothetical protein
VSTVAGGVAIRWHARVGEDCREPMPRTNIGTEFVVPAAQVLHKGVPGADYPCCDDASIKPA